MKRFFIIGLDPITKEETRGIEEWLSSNEAYWWHWLDGMWLVVSRDSDISVSYIRDNVRDITNRTTNLVVEVEPVTWSGLGPSSDERNMFSWIHQNWKNS